MRSELGGVRWILILGACAWASCQQSAPSLTLAGGRTISGEVLERGRIVYAHYCFNCHGESGDGRGVAAPGMRPPPRDFTQGRFKFGGVPAGELPTDEGLLRIARRGLHGTSMLAYDLPEEDRYAVIQYLKTFSPRWKEEAPGEPIAISEDPWKGRTAEAIERGKAVYHVMAKDHAGCASCHPAYVTRAELSQLYEQVTGRALTAFPRDLYRARPRESEYPIDKDPATNETTRALKVMPVDFLLQKTKTVWPLGAIVEGAPYTEERQREDLYRVIGAGIGGAAMPQWKGALPEENLWALVYYVQSLVNLRDTPEGRALRAKLDAQP